MASGRTQQLGRTMSDVRPVLLWAEDGHVYSGIRVFMIVGLTKINSLRGKILRLD